MHKLYEYACDELKELERKADKGLSAAELEYADKLTELKKNILKIDMLEDEGYSAEYRDDMIRSYRGGNRSNAGSHYGSSYAGRRTGRRYSGYGVDYSREGYSRAAEDMVDQLRDMMNNAPDEQTKTDIRRIVEKLDRV